MVKLLFKTLQNAKVTLEAENTETVASLKGRLEKEHNMGAAAAQKLIFQGRVLTDDSTVEQLNFGEKDFIVFMIARSTPATAAPTPAAAPAAATETPAPAAAASTPATPAPAAPSATAPTPATPTPASVASTIDPSGGSTMVTGNVFESVVMQLMEMGFERPQVMAALKAAYNNPDRAAEYLFSGIPEGAAAAPQQSSPSHDEMQTSVGSIDEEPQSPTQMPNLFGGQQPAGGQPGPLDFLRNQAQFQQLRMAVLQNPQLMQPLLQQINQTNPALFQLINQHPTEFLKLIQDGADEGAGAGQTVISVTPEERDAIDRLISLGFERNRVLEAYLACDKNEELAANYLFEHGNEEE